MEDQKKSCRWTRFHFQQTNLYQHRRLTISPRPVTSLAGDLVQFAASLPPLLFTFNLIITLVFLSKNGRGDGLVLMFRGNCTTVKN